MYFDYSENGTKMKRTCKTKTTSLMRRSIYTTFTETQPGYNNIIAPERAKKLTFAETYHIAGLRKIIHDKEYHQDSCFQY